MSIWQNIKLNFLIGTQPVLNLWPSHILYSRKIRGPFCFPNTYSFVLLCFCSFGSFCLNCTSPMSNLWSPIHHLGPLSYSFFRRDALISPTVGKHLLHLNPCRVFPVVSRLCSCCPYPEAIYCLRGSICAVPLCLIAV